jgi:hypothetical protein
LIGIKIVGICQAILMADARLSFHAKNNDVLLALLWGGFGAVEKVSH